MKTFYSSAFLSLILAFLFFLGIKGDGIVVSQDISPPSYRTIIAPPASNDLSDQTFLSRPFEMELYDNFYCDSCDHFALNTLKEIRANYVDIGKATLKIHITPLKDNGDQMTAALAAECAGQQNKFWEFYEKIHSEKPAGGRNVLDPMVKSLKIDMASYAECMANEQTATKVRSVIEQANNRGIKELPTLFIDGYELIGDQPIENIDMVIDKITNAPLNI